MNWLILANWSLLHGHIASLVSALQSLHLHCQSYPDLRCPLYLSSTYYFILAAECVLVFSVSLLRIVCLNVMQRLGRLR